MFKHSIYFKLPFLGAMWAGQRAADQRRRNDAFLAHEWDNGELLLWIGRFDLIWTPAGWRQLKV